MNYVIQLKNWNLVLPVSYTKTTHDVYNYFRMNYYATACVWLALGLENILINDWWRMASPINMLFRLPIEISNYIASFIPSVNYRKESQFLKKAEMLEVFWQHYLITSYEFGPSFPFRTRLFRMEPFFPERSLIQARSILHRHLSHTHTSQHEANITIHNRRLRIIQHDNKKLRNIRSDDNKILQNIRSENTKMEHKYAARQYQNRQKTQRQTTNKRPSNKIGHFRRR